MSAQQVAAEPVAKLYVEARECLACQHVGINDASETAAACNHCGWGGASPLEDHCPCCDSKGKMTAACPVCSAPYSFLADANLAVAQQAPAAVAPPDDARKLICDAWATGDAATKALIEKRTGRWFVWGVDRDSGYIGTAAIAAQEGGAA